MGLSRLCCHGSFGIGDLRKTLKRYALLEPQLRYRIHGLHIFHIILSDLERCMSTPHEPQRNCFLFAAFLVKKATPEH